MSAPIAYVGDILTADGTEQNLIDGYRPGIYVLLLDLSLMEAGDTVVVKRYGDSPYSSTTVLLEQATYTDAQILTGIEIGPIYAPSDNPGAARVSIEQTAGTFRDFGWVLMSF